MPFAGRPLRITVDGDVKEFTKRMTKLQKKIVPKATVAAINKTAAKVVSLSIRSTAKQMSLPRKVLKSRIYLSKRSRATLRRPVATVRISVVSVNSASLMTPGKRKLMITKTHGPVKKRPKRVHAFRRHAYPKAFVGVGNHNNTVIFKRETAASDSSLMAFRVKVWPVALRKVRRFAKNRRIFRHEWEAQMRRFGVS